MTTVITKIRDVNFKEIELTKLKSYKGGQGKLLYISHKNKFLMIQTPKMLAPFGASYFKKNHVEGNDKKFSINATLDDNTEAFKGFVEQLDETVKKLLKKHPDILKVLNMKKMSEDVLNMIYTSMFKHPNDSKYDDYVNLKLAHYNDEFTTTFFDSKGVLLEVRPHMVEDAVPSRSTVKALLHFQSVWLVNGKMGISFKVKQLMVYPEAKIKHCMIDVEVEETVEKLTELQFDSDLEEGEGENGKE